MTKKALLVISAAAVVVAGLFLSLVLVPRIVPDPHARSVAPQGGKAHWAKHYSSLGEMIADVDAIVLARHLDAQPGRVEDADTDPLPFTNNRFQTIRAIKGDVGKTFVVEQTGGTIAGAVYSIDDGGAYAPGDRYVLFLNKQPDTGYYYLINPQGRFHNEGGRLKAAARDRVAAQLHGKSEDEALATLDRASH